MSRRKSVADYAANEIFPGDLVCYASRVGNTVRVSDAIVKKVTAKVIGGRLRPTLVVAPTGCESGFVPRRSMRTEEVETTHVRLITPAEEM